MLLAVEMTLVGWRTDGRPLSPLEFASPLKLGAGEARYSAGVRKWESSKFDLMRLEYSAASPSVEASEQFERRLLTGFENAGAWLAERSPTHFEEIQRQGVQLEVLVSCRMTDNQVELTLPPSLLMQLAERKLRLHVVSND